MHGAGFDSRASGAAIRSPRNPARSRRGASCARDQVGLAWLENDAQTTHLLHLTDKLILKIWNAAKGTHARNKRSPSVQGLYLSNASISAAGMTSSGSNGAFCTLRTQICRRCSSARAQASSQVCARGDLMAASQLLGRSFWVEHKRAG